MRYNETMKQKEPKLDIDFTVRLNAYRIIEDAVERGVRYGIHRAHKHVENPGEEHLIQEIHRAVMNDLGEILKFGDGES